MPLHRVAIVGAGAAGLSAAYALSKHTDKFIVTVFEKEPKAGGMASSMDIDSTLFDASYINDGVQGCSPAFANTLRIFRELGFPPEKVDMQCASYNRFQRFLHSSVSCFALTESVLAKTKPFGRTSFLLHSRSIWPLTSVSSVASLRQSNSSRVYWPCCPYMHSCVSLDSPRISGKEWCTLSPRSSSGQGTRRHMWLLPSL